MEGANGRQAAIQYAAQAGVPFAGIVVPLSGVIAFLDGLSVLLGFRAKVGAWLPETCSSRSR
jgi:putative oxidoreductase